MRKLALMLLLLAGCGSSPDPETSRLQPGDRVLIVDAETRIKMGGLPHRDADAVEYGYGARPDILFLPFGNHVEVISDPGKWSENIGPQQLPRRYVIVAVKDGQHAGKSLKIARDYLRPLP